MPAANENPLGTYLKDRRAKLDPSSFGLPLKRRRTPGLRREEVAQRANVSATWYTWLEQGRGGAPSADVLDRIARAMMLTDVEREHIYLLGLGRPPEVRYHPPEGVTPRLQRLLDALTVSPAFIKTPAWDVVAWNEAAAAVFTDYENLPPKQRNILRLFFSSDALARQMQKDWEHIARFIVAAFRADTVRAGAVAEVRALVDEMCATNPDFARMWRDNDVRTQGDGTKHLHNPLTGPIAMEYSAFAVDGRPDLGLTVYNPVSREDAEKVKILMKARRKAMNAR